LSFHQPKSGIAKISILDMNGSVVKTQTENFNAGRASVSIEISALPAATYMISVQNEAGKIQQKFIKQ